MSYGGYQQYGGNPYGSTEQEADYPPSNPYGQTTTTTASTPYGQTGTYGASNPYGREETTSGYGASNPYGREEPTSGYGAANPYGQSNPYGGQAAQETVARPTATHTTSGASNYSRPGGYATDPVPALPTQTVVATAPVHMSTIMSNPDFLARVEGVKTEIRQLTANVSEIGMIHQRVLGSPDNSSSAQLENLVAQTQILNTRIKDQIKQLETDAAKSNKNQTKDSQIRTLKSNFKSQLEDYQREEQTYRTRYREQIARQYRIVNPEASDLEVREAADADWGDEGVFQTALKSNRTGAANSVLGSVRARHNDIQQIERTLIELNQLFQDLAEAVVVQEAPIMQTEALIHKVHEDTEAGNKQLDKGIKSARNARKLKWICFGIFVLIIVILALVLGLYFGLKKKNG